MTETKKNKKKRGWFRFAAYLVLLALGFLAGGFLAFAYHVDRQLPPSPVPSADGVVVWTGKGGNRLSAGAELLRAQKGERLLISGVNEQNSRADIITLLELGPDIATCCVDLDYEARDTIGNARETANWAKALGYKHIILVTSAYHMPRAEIEIAASHGDIRITPYPVTAKNGRPWWRDGDRFKQIFQEYGKLLVTYARRAGDGRENSIQPAE